MTMNFQDFDLPGSVQALPSSVAAKKTSKSGFYRSFAKRLFDVTAVLMAAPVVVPVVAALAVGVMRDGGSIFYSQTRIGKDGKKFRMWKLRSMVVDADARMESYLAGNPEARVEWDETQKLKDDPRITSFGGFLRRSSMDELPQLWNVLVGDMSLVGPRPMMTCQEALYPGQGYYMMRPGVTGPWQVSGRNETTFAARASFDDEYESNITLKGDLQILLKTVGVVVKATGV